MAGYRLTPLADSDVAHILYESRVRFGPVQQGRYAALIESALDMLAEQPLRPGSRDRDDLVPGLRSFHVSLAATRRAAAVHVIFYFPAGVVEEANASVIVLRVLHQSMEPALYVADNGES